jgi:hypothetical protein
MGNMWLLVLVNIVFGLLTTSLIAFIVLVLVYQFYGGYLLLRYPDGMDRWKNLGIKYFPPIKYLFALIPNPPKEER